MIYVQANILSVYLYINAILIFIGHVLAIIYLQYTFMIQDTFTIPVILLANAAI
jgi:hypothetical protein